MIKPSSNAILLNAIFNKVATDASMTDLFELPLSKDTAAGSKSLQMFFYNLRVEDGKDYSSYLDFLKTSPKASTCSLEDALYELSDLRILKNNVFSVGKTIEGPAPDAAIVDEIASKMSAFLGLEVEPETEG